MLLTIVLQFAEGGEIFHKINNKTKLNEDETTLYFYQLISAIQYLQLNTFSIEIWNMKTSALLSR